LKYSKKFTEIGSREKKLRDRGEKKKKKIKKNCYKKKKNNKKGKKKKKKLQILFPKKNLNNE